MRIVAGYSNVTDTKKAFHFILYLLLETRCSGPKRIGDANRCSQVDFVRRINEQYESLQ